MSCRDTGWSLTIPKEGAKGGDITVLNMVSFFLLLPFVIYMMFLGIVAGQMDQFTGGCKKHTKTKKVDEDITKCQSICHCWLIKILLVTVLDYFRSWDGEDH